MSKIITLEQLKAINPAVNDVVGALVADAVNAWVENATSRCWGEDKTVTELYDASGVVWLSHMDVTAVAELKMGYPNEDRETRDASSYSWTKSGRLILSYYRQLALPPSTLDYVEVTYTYGVPEENIPADLVLATLGLATGYYEYIGNSGREVSRAQVGSYSLQFASGAGENGEKNSRDWQVINSYAQRRV